MRTNQLRTTKLAGRQKRSNILSVALALAAITFGLAVSAGAQTETVLYNFGSYANDAAGGGAGLIFDAAGNLYGTTNGGGSGNSGAVYELSPAGGGWNETLLYQFTGGGDGGSPSSGLTFDAAGNLYGTTFAGGTGSGVVYELSPSGSGWTETVLYTFTGGADGARPIAGVIFDPAGNLYGAAEQGGSTTNCVQGCGVVFKLSPSSGGAWTESVIHTFQGSDGSIPIGGLTLHSGALFGTTYNGGAFNIGTVFELKRVASGWNYQLIHTFADGYFPEASVIFDTAGNLYGTAYAGGTHGGGVAFEMKPGGGGIWGFRVLHNFSGFNDGNFPLAPLIMDSAGSLYGTAFDGGVITQCQDNGCGLVFKLTPGAGGSWAETVLHTFTGSPDGQAPELGALIFDSAGNLYGTTTAGGTNSAGIAFEITP
jgi:uncharacterized repeat protein (TIGR03803 family)